MSSWDCWPGLSLGNHDIRKNSVTYKHWAFFNHFLCQIWVLRGLSLSWKQVPGFHNCTSAHLWPLTTTSGTQPLWEWSEGIHSAMNGGQARLTHQFLLLVPSWLFVWMMWWGVGNNGAELMRGEEKSPSKTSKLQSCWWDTCNIVLKLRNDCLGVYSIITNAGNDGTYICDTMTCIRDDCSYVYHNPKVARCTPAHTSISFKCSFSWEVL